MSESPLISLKNGVIASLIASVILLIITDIIPAIKEYFVRFILWLWDGLLWCWGILMSSYSIPGWALFILVLCAIAGITIVGVAAVYLIGKASFSEPWYASYVKDTIYGVEWRWRWVENSISDLWCYCPRCEATLLYEYHRPFQEKIYFGCENCNQSVLTSIPGGDKAYALQAVTREIDRRIRTGRAKRKLEQFSLMDGEK